MPKQKKKQESSSLIPEVLFEGGSFKYDSPVTYVSTDNNISFTFAKTNSRDHSQDTLVISRCFVGDEVIVKGGGPWTICCVLDGHGHAGANTVNRLVEIISETYPTLIEAIIDMLKQKEGWDKIELTSLVRDYFEDVDKKLYLDWFKSAKRQNQWTKGGAVMAGFLMHPCHLFAFKLGDSHIGFKFMQIQTPVSPVEAEELELYNSIAKSTSDVRVKYDKFKRMKEPVDTNNDSYQKDRISYDNELNQLLKAIEERHRFVSRYLTSYKTVFVQSSRSPPDKESQNVSDKRLYVTIPPHTVESELLERQKHESWSKESEDHMRYLEGNGFIHDRNGHDPRVEVENTWLQPSHSFGDYGVKVNNYETLEDGRYKARTPAIASVIYKPFLSDYIDVITSSSRKQGEWILLGYMSSDGVECLGEKYEAKTDSQVFHTIEKGLLTRTMKETKGFSAPYVIDGSAGFGARSRCILDEISRKPEEERDDYYTDDFTFLVANVYPGIHFDHMPKMKDIVGNVHADFDIKTLHKGLKLKLKELPKACNDFKCSQVPMSSFADAIAQTFVSSS